MSDAGPRLREETVYRWRVLLRRGPRRSIYWRRFPGMMTTDEAQAWARAHHATLRRVLFSAEKRYAEDLQAEVADQLQDARGG